MTQFVIYTDGACPDGKADDLPLPSIGGVVFAAHAQPVFFLPVHCGSAGAQQCRKKAGGSPKIHVQ